MRAKSFHQKKINRLEIVLITSIGNNTDVAANNCQFVGSINFEGNSTTVDHCVAYLKGSTRVIKINESNILHYSDSILESKQFMSTTHTLFYISTSCLESENEVLQDYIIMGYSESTSTFISPKSIDLCMSGKVNDEIVNGIFTFLERYFSAINCLPTEC